MKSELDKGDDPVYCGIIGYESDHSHWAGYSKPLSDVKVRIRVKPGVYRGKMVPVLSTILYS